MRVERVACWEGGPVLTLTGYAVSGRGFTSPTLQLLHDGCYATVVGCEAVSCILWAPVSSEGMEGPCCAHDEAHRLRDRGRAS